MLDTTLQPNKEQKDLKQIFDKNHPPPPDSMDANPKGATSDCATANTHATAGKGEGCCDKAEAKPCTDQSVKHSDAKVCHDGKNDSKR